MTGKLIFKMEIFKYLRDRKYLISAGIIGCLNIIVCVYFLFAADRVNGSVSVLEDVMIFITLMTVVANLVFMFLYPFHLMAMDYKNNVMALMIASGVERTKLFFCKIGAALLWTVALVIAMNLVPLLLIFTEAGLVAVSEFFGNFNNMLIMADLSLWEMLLFYFVGYLNTLVMISTATIITKGSNMTFFLFLGFQFVNGVVSNLFLTVPVMLHFSVIGMKILTFMLTLLMMSVFILIALNTLKKQNL